MFIKAALEMQRKQMKTIFHHKQKNSHQISNYPTFFSIVDAFTCASKMHVIKLNLLTD